MVLLGRATNLTEFSWLKRENLLNERIEDIRHEFFDNELLK
jgi:hypothetical protein